MHVGYPHTTTHHQRQSAAVKTSGRPFRPSRAVRLAAGNGALRAGLARAAHRTRIGITDQKKKEEEKGPNHAQHRSSEQTPVPSTAQAHGGSGGKTACLRFARASSGPLPPDPTTQMRQKKEKKDCRHPAARRRRGACQRSVCCQQPGVLQDRLGDDHAPPSSEVRPPSPAICATAGMPDSARSSSETVGPPAPASSHSEAEGPRSSSRKWTRTEHRSQSRHVYTAVGSGSSVDGADGIDGGYIEVEAPVSPPD